MPIDPDDIDLGVAVLAIARSSIAAEFNLARGALPPHAALAQPGASFVTLKQGDELRGCIGSLVAEWPLGRDVGRNAIAAAFHDPRFDALTRAEFDRTSIEVSVLGAASPIGFADEGDLLAQLQPNVDGVILEYGGRRATFLPQVWMSLPSRRDFLEELKRKLGVPADFPPTRLNVSRYRVVQWRERDLIAAAPPVKLPQ